MIRRMTSIPFAIAGSVFVSSAVLAELATPWFGLLTLAAALHLWLLAAVLDLTPRRSTADRP